MLLKSVIITVQRNENADRKVFLDRICVKAVAVFLHSLAVFW